jgi:tripartite-type tricarboxylate transporter receptor subunit TctC
MRVTDASSDHVRDAIPRNVGLIIWRTLRAHIRALRRPAGTPADVVAKIGAETGRVLKLPEIQAKLGSQGLYAVPSTPAQFDAHIKSETARYAKIVKEAGIKAD